jgi:predicted DNA-binding transcriptional regulator YafY
MRWGTERRLEFVEFRIFWDGVISRGELVEEFGVSVPQASADFALYQKMAPGNIEYDSSKKRYVATPAFSPKYLIPNADRYLAQLKAISDGVMSLRDTWISTTVDLDALPIPSRRYDPQKLKRFLEVIRKRGSIEIQYQSLTSDGTRWRRISPHALGSDGLRWHLRAYCHESDVFKDFVLTRCHDLRSEGDGSQGQESDALWNSFFEIVLIPNPKLGPSQQEAVQEDYDMKDGAIRIPVRQALLYYFNKRLRLDVAESVDRPLETPLVVANRTDFETLLAKIAI